MKGPCGCKYKNVLTYNISFGHGVLR